MADYLRLFVSAMVFGVSVAAPVGPIGILCIRRTLAHGRLHGLVTGLGVATADGLYSLIAAFGLTVVSDFLVSGQAWIHLLGSVFLLYLGIRIALTKPAEQAAQAKDQGFLGMYASAFLLTITNPVTILEFGAVFAGLGLATHSDTPSMLLITAGVFSGSLLWWLTLSTGVSLLRSRFTPRLMLWVNRVSGAAIIILGLLIVGNLIF